MLPTKNDLFSIYIAWFFLFQINTYEAIVNNIFVIAN